MSLLFCSWLVWIFTFSKDAIIQYGVNAAKGVNSAPKVPTMVDKWVCKTTDIC